MNRDLDLGHGLEGSLAVVTGAAGQIGQVVVKAFLAAGSYVSGLDRDETKFNFQHDRLFWQRVDVTDEDCVEQAFKHAQDKFNRHANICIAAAGLDLSFIEHHRSIISMPVEQFRTTMDVNVTGVFITSKVWMKNLEANATDDTRNASLVLFGSEAGSLGVPGNVDYGASKSAVQYGFLKSLAPEAANIFHRARVNAIAPGPVDTPMFRRECAESKDGRVRWIESMATVPLKRPIPMEDVAKMCIILASESLTQSMTGQVLPVDGGKSGRLFYNVEGAPFW